MININSLIRKLTLATIVLSTTDIVRVLIDSISIYRIILLATTFLAVIHTLHSGKVKKGRYLLFLILLLASPVAYFLSTNKEWALSFMLNDYMGILLVFLICNYFTIEDKDKLLKSFIQSQFFTIAFSIYSLYMYYIAGGIPLNINFLEIFNITLSEDFLRRGTISSQVRLSLPYATPPHLSIVMVVAICILFFQKNLFSNKLRYTLIGMFGAILLLTNSRTGIAAGVIVLILVVLINFNFKFKIEKMILFMLVTVGGVLAVLIFDFQYISRLLNRFVIEDITQDRHLLVPIEGLIIWTDNLKNFLLGIGYGSSINMSGKFTILPPYFLNSFVTLLAEKGLVGLLLVLEFFRLFWISLKSIKDKTMNSSYNVFSYCYLIIFMSFMFYEAKQNISVWVIIGIIFMLDRHRVHIEKTGRFNKIID